MALALGARLRPPGCVRVAEVTGEAVLLNLATREYFTLDAVGTRMWKRICEAATLGDALGALAPEYDVLPGVLAADLERLASELVSRGLLQVEEPELE